MGISKALAERPNLIKTDLYLPDMTAVDATVMLKQDPATSDIPIVVLTAMTTGEWKTKALKAGVAKYLIKPISRSELTEAVLTLIPPPSSLETVSQFENSEDGGKLQTYFGRKQRCHPYIRFVRHSKWDSFMFISLRRLIATQSLNGEVSLSSR